MIATSGAEDHNVNDLVQRFHEDCDLRGMVSTMEYIYRVKEYCAFLNARGKTPITVGRDDMKAFLGQLKARELKFGTIKRIYTCVSAFYEFLIAEELVEYNPIVPFRKYYLSRYKSDNDSESRKLIGVEDASRLVNSILDSRDKCILVLLFKTGMRVGELISLDVGDADLDKGEVTLKIKKKRSNRVLFLDDEAIAVLQRWLVARRNRKGAVDPALFLSKVGTRIAKRSIEDVIEKHAERWACIIMEQDLRRGSRPIVAGTGL